MSEDSGLKKQRSSLGGDTRKKPTIDIISILLAELKQRQANYQRPEIVNEKTEETESDEANPVDRPKPISSVH